MSKLERYGLEWKSDQDFVCHPMDDGYWTPWHIAEEQNTTLRHQLEQAQARVALLESAVPWTIYGDNLTATILRKQAEAVESARCRAKIKLIGRNPTAKKVFDLLNQEAGCLRQQADEIEKAGGEQ